MSSRLAVTASKNWQRWPDMPFTYHHENPPAPFNPDFRPGLGDALHKAHALWCQANPTATRQERAAAYRATSTRLRPDYPTVAQMGGK